MMSVLQVRRHLERLGACQEALDWLADRDPAQAWASCQSADWLAWLADKLDLWSAETRAAHDPVRVAASDAYEAADRDVWTAYARAVAKAEADDDANPSWITYSTSMDAARNVRKTASASAQTARDAALVASIRALIPWSAVESALTAGSSASTLTVGV